METNEICKPKGIWKAVIRKESTGEIVSSNEYVNLIPTIGRTAMAAQIFDNTTVNAKITYLAVGSGTTTPANTDTTLETETVRRIVQSKNNVGIVGSSATLFSAGEATGTHREFGAFGNGITSTASASTDTGILYSRSAANETVAADETLTLTYRITFN